MKTALISILGIIIVAVLTFFSIKLLKNYAPEAEKKARVENVPLVEVETARQLDLEFPLTSEGTVSIRRETVLSAQVAGKIVQVDPAFEEGATYPEGHLIARIDPVDYEAAVAQTESALADAKLALVQEQARADQAARDWKKIGGGRTPSDLVLRKPFLESARARVAAATASLEQALKNLERTEIRAPFPCRLRSVSLNLGAVVVPGTQLARLYDPTQLAIRLPFSLDDYAQIPPDSEIMVSASIGAKRYQWQAETMWEMGEIDERTLSAYLLARILPNDDNPARFRLPPPGIFLQATLAGAVMPKVVEIPRSAVRGKNTVFILGKDDQLEIRDITIARSTKDAVYASEGLADGDKVVLTKLSVPIVGMALKEAPDPEPAETPAAN